VTLPILSAAAALYMLGVGCVVQFVAYPLFADVGPDRFVEWHAGWSRRITPVVLAAMVVELASAAWLLAAPPAGVGRLLPAIGLVCAAVAWLSTALLQVPAHGRLSAGFSVEAHRRLLSTSWLRTGAWAVHSLVACLIVSAAA